MLGVLLLCGVALVCGVGVCARVLRVKAPAWLTRWPKHQCECRWCRDALKQCVCPSCVSARSRVRMRARKRERASRV